MKRHVSAIHVLPSLFGIILCLCSGCSEDGVVEPIADTADLSRQITADGVGDYIIGQSTLQEILGSDTPSNRDKFTDKGLYFEFDQGTELTGVTISSSDYSLKNGITIGSTSVEVRDILGKPSKTSIEILPKGIQMDALVYNDYMFLLDESKNVYAIRVGK